MQKEKIRLIIPVLLLLIGAMLLFYPFISEYVFEHRVESQIFTYENVIDGLDQEKHDRMMAEAHTYNETLMASQVRLTDPFILQDTSDDISYSRLLSVDDTGIMAYVEIPSISVYLPIYHGTSSAVLKSGAGHLEGASLPVGGCGTHTVITGHTGLNSAKLFTDLTELKDDDIFFIHVLGDTLAYQVCEIHTVLPEDTSKLLIQQDRDLATLVTCTPYGVNTHRLLVTGERISYSEEAYADIMDEGDTDTGSLWMNTYKKAILIGLVITSLFFICVLLIERARRKNISKYIGAVLLLAGILIYISPAVKSFVQRAKTQAFVSTFSEQYGRKYKAESGSAEAGEGEAADGGGTAYAEDDLYREIRDYNRALYDSGQADFMDPWSYEQSPIFLDGFEDGIFGYIDIPDMNQTMPLYIGASSGNMAKGAAILGQTSIPIGGENVNTVIAGHRGYDGKPFFKEIENLRVGDHVYITNPWETLSYIVETIDIIEPYDVDAVKIQEGKDMVTLLTCHPYASGGKFRYVVYCVRDGNGSEAAEGPAEETVGREEGAGYIVASDGTVYESSRQTIDGEKFFRRVSLGSLLVLLAACFIKKIAERIKALNVKNK